MYAGVPTVTPIWVAVADASLAALRLRFDGQDAAELRDLSRADIAAASAKAARAVMPGI